SRISISFSSMPGTSAVTRISFSPSYLQARPARLQRCKAFPGAAEVTQGVLEQSVDFAVQRQERIRQFRQRPILLPPGKQVFHTHGCLLHSFLPFLLSLCDAERTARKNAG